MTLTGLSADLTWDTVSKEAEFERLMGLHERRVLRTALRLTGRLEDAQDASQEVFLRLYRHLGRVPEAALEAWLYRTTVNVCYDLLRRRRRSGGQAVEGPEPSVPATAAQELEESAKRRLVEQGLKRLTPQERAALVLCSLEGLSTAEAAAAMGVAEGTVRSHLSLARTRLKEYVGRLWR
ncbi:MAG: RNA polymerase sigma factor [Bryobacteraceae bacterium]